MKRFIDKNGTFEIKVPVTWRYSLNESEIHTFQEYDIWKHDAFQISFHNLDTPEKEKRFLAYTKSLTELKDVGDEVYRLQDKVEDDFTVKAWMKLCENKVVTFTLTHSNSPDGELDNQPIDEKVSTVHSIISDFHLIDQDKSQDYINSYQFDMFIQGVGATALILNKAVENKAFFEATCILGNQIDALLRIAIVLKSQIINSDSKIESEWIHQGLTDKKKSEKYVYKKALELGIIDQNKYDELFKLYEDRNRVIHRFIISNITLAEVEKIAFSYYQMTDSINKIVYDIEMEQIRLGVGMTVLAQGETTEQSNSEYLKGKIGKLDYFDEKKDD